MIIKKISTFVGLVSILLLLAWIISCAVNPVTGKRELMLLSEADEAGLGAKTDQQVIQTYGVYDDPELTAYITNLGREMAKSTHRPNLEWQFKVLDTPVINAFAVPGGYLYFTRGILGYFNNEAELAGVLGHELGHVTARHSAVQYSRQMLAQVGMGLGMVFSEKFRKYAGIANFGVGMLFLRFSRDNERQSDDLGAQYSFNMGYDTNYMANFFTTLERLHPSADNAGLPGWYSTHPNPVDRVGAVKRKSAELQKTAPGKTFKINRNEYLAQVDGITFGEDPRNGYVDGNAFYHPDMNFMFPVPAGWQLNNTPSQVQIVSKQQDAAIMLSVGKASSPSVASQEFVQNATSKVYSSDNIRVNGLTAHKLVSDVPSENDTMRVLSYFIQKDGAVYQFHGLSSQSGFSGYQNTFTATMSKFNRVKNKSKLQVQPKHLLLKTVTKAGTLKNTLAALGVPENKQEEFAVLNGMYLTDTIKQGTKIKVAGK
jgi:predicted Zn-dependent protease